jgi:hypothetical protein
LISSSIPQPVEYLCNTPYIWQMKKLFLLLYLGLSGFLARADEGMWLPMLISQNYDEMQRLGFKLTPEQIYSVNQSSLKDAIVHFGGGCTAEIISNKGLVLTNHHCGFGNIAAVSTVEKNYLVDGFMAKSQDEEIPCPGLSLKFLVRIEDVTDRVQDEIGDAYGKEVETRFDAIAKIITKAANEGDTYESEVKSFYAGNKYYLFVYQRFTDIRLVGTPPENLGKFGGDTDNWMWPRHTCDFSLFRIYCNNDNKPAAYDKNNRPYVPKHYLPVSMKGVKESDYTMVMGYPGRTTRYMTSYGVDNAISIANPTVVKIRDKRLALMREEMEKDPSVDLAYASTYASIANYWKYFIGQTEQLKNLQVVTQKQNEEADFQEWAKRNNKQYKKVLSDYQKAYASYQPYLKHSIFMRESFMAPAVTKLASTLAPIKKAMKENVSIDSLDKLCKKIAKGRKAILKGMNLTLEKKMFSSLLLMFYQDVPKAQHPAYFSSAIFGKHGSEDWKKVFDEFTENLYSQTRLTDSTWFAANCTGASVANLMQDPFVEYAFSVQENYDANYASKEKDYTYEMFELNRAYQAAMLQMNEGKKMYPDANSTMRVTYGTVGSYAPKDAVFYNYYSTAEGLLAKYKPGDREFDLQPHIVDLLRKKDYGDYADRNAGTLVTCFITNNDITGGNSGSPVLNASGELIGTAFDGNWEAMSGDIAFDKRYKRTIVADIRYVLWVVDKVLGGRMLLEEMTLRH